MPGSQSRSAAIEDRPAPKITLFGRDFRLPRSRWLRVLIGIGLIVLGIFGFLPVLGFWMVPLGLLVLSYEFHIVRRLRRRFVVRWQKRRQRSAR
jgi:purine-cytosine permease-like protein